MARGPTRRRIRHDAHPHRLELPQPQPDPGRAPDQVEELPKTALTKEEESADKSAGFGV